MANFSALKTAIQNAIKQNGNEEITGNVLQQILLSIVSTMGDGAINTIEQNLSNEATTRQGADTQLQNAINAIKANIDIGYVYAGIATPSTTPVSGKVFYIATAAGTYTNFGGQVLTQGINILRYNGSAWSSQQLIGIDDVPIVGSNSLVKSGGVQNELALGAVYDVSAKNPTAGPNNDGKWESLSALFSDANLNTLIPTAYRKGGMSIKFVHSSDNKYVQCRLMADSWSIDTNDWAIAEEGVYVENPEFIRVITDNENRILYAVKADGDFYFGAGVPQQIIDYVKEHTDATKEELLTLIDTKVDKEEGKSLINAEYASSIQFIENPEFIEAKTDAEGKLLAGRTHDGAAFENVGFSTPKVSINGATIENIEDLEGRYELTLDSENKIISYRKDDGTLVENAGIETPNVTAENISAKEVNIEGGEATLEKATLNSLELTNEGMAEFQQALKDTGFHPGGAGDYTDKSSMQIPIPRLAFVNITAPNGNAIWPTSKAGRDDYNPGVNCELQYYMEFYDGAGNYFKKEIIFSAQGNSSMKFPKKNGAVDICNNNGWDDDDTFNIKFGDWVTQDSFHFKAYYTNFLKGEPVVGYKLAEEIFKNRGIEKDTTWKQAILPQYDIASDSYNSDNINDITIQSGVGPKCYPDGFPAIFYLNGEFYGVYSWQLKKHRDNYFMDKSNPKHIHLDGEITAWTIFDGIIRWENFEIRNPKNLVYAAVHTDLSGKSTFKYDADIPNGQDEIAGTDNNYEGDWTAGSYAIGKVVKHNNNYFINQVANNSNEPITADGSGNKNTAKDPDFKNKTGCGWINCTNTIKVKDYIKSFSIIKREIHDASTELEKLEIYASRFDKDNFIDYTIFSLITANYDGFAKNWQWTTWDGNRWFVNPYDLDGILGYNFMGTFAEPATMTQSDDYRCLALTGIYPIKYVTSYANTFADMKATYKKLRDNGTISIETFRHLIYNWCNRVGVDNLKKEYKKWTATPCNIDPVINEPWQITDDWSWGSNTYNPNTTYNEGDSCWYGRRKFIAGAQVTGVLPASVLGYRDSIYRICKWFEERLELEDIYLEYSE